MIVDARAIDRSGIGRYVRELVPRLVRRGAFGEVILCGNTADLGRFADRNAPGARIESLDGGRYSATALRAWRVLARRLPRHAAAFFPHWDARPGGCRCRPS